MATFSALVDSTIMYLSGYTNRQDASTHLTAGIAAGDVSIPVADTTVLSRGLVEIDSEMIWVDSLGTSTLTVPPYGRGFRGSTAASHLTGARVVSAPLFPRFLVKNAINDAIQSVFPSLNGIGSTSFTFNPAVTTYSLPTGTESVLQVRWQAIGPSKEWLPVRRWDMDSATNLTAFPTGSSISLYDAIVPGRTVQVTYVKQPTPLVNDTDDFATVTGLPASCEDLIRLGAAYRLVPFLDSPHLTGNTAEADFSSNMRPVGAAGQLGKQLLQMYRLRLEEETNKQQSLYPIRAHFTR